MFSSAGKRDHGQNIPWLLDDDDDELQSHGRERSYTCLFCRRGFSNAQALGGHMNVHRRDRARLKQANEESSLDVITNSASAEFDGGKAHKGATRSFWSSKKGSSASGSTPSGEPKSLVRGFSSNTPYHQDSLDLELRLG